MNAVERRNLRKHMKVLHVDSWHMKVDPKHMKIDSKHMKVDSIAC